MFTANKITIPVNPILTKPIAKPKSWFMTTPLDNFDREGFQLSPIEQEYYQANNVLLTDKDISVKKSGEDDWNAVLHTWFRQDIQHENIYLDHSYISVRYRFEGEALEQLLYHAKSRPELYKIAYVKSKFGDDFCVDWCNEDGVYELIHWEWDFYDYSALIRHVIHCEHALSGFNWEEYREKLTNLPAGIADRASDEYLSWQSQFFGMSKPFRYLKCV